MSELYDRIVSQRGAFENLLARIPGFRGYLEKATRRTADRILRDYVADLLSRRIDRLVQLERRLLDQGGMAYMSQTASAKLKLQTYRDRVAAAMPGYSAFDSAVKVDENELEIIYSFDEALISYVDRIDSALDALENAIAGATDIEPAIANIDALSVEANEAFSLREQVLTNLDQSLMK
jgi:hypothetical protein